MNETQILDFKMLVGEKLSFPSGAGGGGVVVPMRFSLCSIIKQIGFSLCSIIKQIDQEEW